MLAKSTEPSAAHQIPKQITEYGCFDYLNYIVFLNHFFFSCSSLYSNTHKDSMRRCIEVIPQVTLQSKFQRTVDVIEINGKVE